MTAARIWSRAARATIHCLTGCVIGEVAGLAIGTTPVLVIWVTIGLATGFAYISGFALGLRPVMRDENIGIFRALHLIWIGESISIGVMEIVMNAIDFSVGEIQAISVLVTALSRWRKMISSIWLHCFYTDRFYCPYILF